MHAPWQPCTPSWQPRIPPATTHAPQATIHAPSNYACPPHGQNSWHTLLKILPCPKLRLRAVTRMHSSRIHTIHCSGRHGECLPVGVVCLWGLSACGGCLPVGGVCLPSACWGTHLLPVDRILDTSLWKHYLSAISFADGSYKNNKEQKAVLQTHRWLYEPAIKPPWWTNTVLWRYFVISHWSTCCCCDRYKL